MLLFFVNFLYYWLSSEECGCYTDNSGNGSCNLDGTIRSVVVTTITWFSWCIALHICWLHNLIAAFDLKFWAGISFENERITRFSITCRGRIIWWCIISWCWCIHEEINSGSWSITILWAHAHVSDTWNCLSIKNKIGTFFSFSKNCIHICSWFFLDQH